MLDLDYFICVLANDAIDVLVSVLEDRLGDVNVFVNEGKVSD
jgi:hypothetical protein